MVWLNIFLSQSVLERGIPFQIKIPNDVTLQAIKDARNGVNMEEVTFDGLEQEMDNITLHLSN